MKYSLLITIIVFLVSCKKNEVSHNVVDGILIHSGTKKPLSGVRVSLWEGLPSGTNGNNSYDTTFTDTTGHFHIEQDGNQPVMYLYKKGYSFEYIVGGAVIGIVPLNIGVNKNLKFEMDASAYFDPTFQNKFNNSSDLLKFSDYAITNFVIKNGIEATSYETFWGYEPYRPYKENPNKAIGDKYHLYILEITRNRAKTTIVDSVNIKSFTTYTDTIYY
jgi:hypothetical protein